MKKLRVYVVENDVNKAETLANRLNENKGVLESFDIEFVPGRFDYTNLFSPIALTQTKPDMLIIDSSTANQTFPPSSRPIADQIRSQYPFLPILLTHRGDTLEKFRISTSELSNRQVQGLKVFDGFIDPNTRTIEIQKTVKTNLRKPLKLGIIGLGVLGRQFLKTFTRSNEVEKIKAYSEHVPKETVLKSIDHLGARRDKVGIVKNLEDTLDHADCVLLCTSAVHSPNLQDKLAIQTDRFDLLPQEGQKLYYYLQRIKQASYQGLVVPFTNPVGGILALGKLAGLKHQQLTSPINIDTARFDDAVREELGADYPLFLDALMSGKIVGEHGIPKFARFENKIDSSKVDYGEAIERLYKTINNALLRARQMPKDALAGVTELAEADYQAVPESVKFFSRLAHFDEAPDESAYCYYKPNGVKGFTALPVRISYFPEIRVFPNMNYIEQFDAKTIHDIKEELTLQNLYLDKFLS